MAKNLKINIKNTQLAKAINLAGVKSKLKNKKSDECEKEQEELASTDSSKQAQAPIRRKAKNKSAFASDENIEQIPIDEELENVQEVIEAEKLSDEGTSDEVLTRSVPEGELASPEASTSVEEMAQDESSAGLEAQAAKEEPAQEPASGAAKAEKKEETESTDKKTDFNRDKKGKKDNFKEDDKKKSKPKDGKSFKRLKEEKSFNSRDGFKRDEQWRKKRPAHKAKLTIRQEVQRPTSLSIRLPITIKDLASQMKLKASQLISKLFMEGVVLTLNDYLDDETTVQLLGHEFECEITIDTSEQERIRITSESIEEEIKQSPRESLQHRSPIVAFMGHVDHGKTSIIDALRKSKVTAGEAGAITQHIGAFRYQNNDKSLTILDTPGHEAFSAMRARGANVTDIVVLVVAGDEGLRQQTIEAIQHARAAGVQIVVAINKSDKPNFNPDEVQRQLAEQELLCEAWGGSTITVNCSALTGDGLDNLIEMLFLQAEVLELDADPSKRARGSILESCMHKGMGATATVLVQNGTLYKGDALVLGSHFGRVKTMQDENGREIEKAGPSCPVKITGLSGLPEAGQEFIVMKDEKAAKSVSEARLQEDQGRLHTKKGVSIEHLLQKVEGSEKKILKLVLRADMQGSLEALKSALSNIESEKVHSEIIFSGAGEISESDIQLASASKAVIVGFHTQIESHAEALIKQLQVQVFLYDVIYHAVDKVKDLMSGMLDKLTEEQNMGCAEVRARFKVSRLGVIAGCFVAEGLIKRNHQMRVRRGDEIIWNGRIDSLKREKDDVKEVKAGMECGILLNGFNDLEEGDRLESFEIREITQEL